MTRRRSLTTPSLIIALALGSTALFTQPASASDRFSEVWGLGLARFESTLERAWSRLSWSARAPIQPADGAVLVPGGKDGAVLVPGGITPPTPPITQPTLKRPTTMAVKLEDKSY
jgi:hypothetical protein